MKRLILIIAVFVLMVLGFGIQNAHAYEKGYNGNVSISENIGINKGLINNVVEITTSHGYNFGDGMYMGGGIGLNFGLNGSFAGVPMFYEMKYNIVDWKISPYVDCRVGTTIGAEHDNPAFLVSPGFGFDYRKISFRAGYKCEAGGYVKLHSVALSIAFNF